MDFIYNKVLSLLKHNDYVVILISGASCSGKSTAAKMLQEKFFDLPCICICQDSWFKDYSDIKRGVLGYPNMESTDSFHINELRNDISLILKEKTAYIPDYSITSNTRISKNKLIKFEKIMIIEGLHAVSMLTDILYDFARRPQHDNSASGEIKKTGFCGFVLNTPVEICAKRRALRDKKFFPYKDSRFFINHYLTVISENYKPFFEIEEKTARQNENIFLHMI